MPNIVNNLLAVGGDIDAVAAFAAKARGRPPQFAGATGGRVELALNFHSLVPLPDRHADARYDPDGIRMEREAWGMKWGASEIRTLPDPGLATYRFVTPWVAPHAVFLPKVAKAFPHLKFWLSWGGEGPTRGFGLWWLDDAVASCFDDTNMDGWPDDDPDLDDDANFSREEAFTYEFFHSHMQRVGADLAHWAGMAFDIVGPAADWLDDRNGWGNHARWLAGQIDPFGEG